MKPEEKNLALIKTLETKKNELTVIREHFEGNYNNATAKEVIKKLREVGHWIDELVETYK